MAQVVEKSDQNKKSVKDLAKQLETTFGGNAPFAFIGPGNIPNTSAAIKNHPSSKKLEEIFANSPNRSENAKINVQPLVIPQQQPKNSEPSSEITSKSTVNYDSSKAASPEPKSTNALPVEQKVQPEASAFPFQKVDYARVSQSLQGLSALLDIGLTTHNKLKKKMGSFSVKLRGGFLAKLSDDELVSRRVDSFWGKFQTIIQSAYPKQMTYSSMLGTVLILIVEARQTCLDLHDFGMRMKQSSKAVMKSEVVVNLLQTLEKLEKELDEVLYFVGHSLASDSASRKIVNVKAENLEEYLAKKNDVKLPAILGAPLMLLADRMDPSDQELLAKLIPELNRLQRMAQSFYNQKYEDTVILLFIAETVGKAAWDAATSNSSVLKSRAYNALSQVSACARANAWGLIRESSGLDLSIMLNLPETVTGTIGESGYILAKSD